VGLFNFNRNKKQVLNSGFQTDIHSHLIPGIDDGVRSMEESVSLISELAKSGYTRIITTPHIRSEVFPNTPETILSGLEQVKIAVAEKNIQVTIEAAAEYYVDDYFLNLIEEDTPLLCFGNSKYLLIEFSHFSPPLNYKTIIFDLQSKGYRVVLAHPERYYYFHNNFDIYRDLYERGVLLQLNLVSLVGFFDNAAAKIAKKIADSGMYSFVGTDTHNKHYIQACNKVYGQKFYQTLKERCTIINDLI
jgi:protein-tyrosine phosphatase